MWQQKTESVTTKWYQQRASLAWVVRLLKIRILVTASKCMLQINQKKCNFCREELFREKRERNRSNILILENEGHNINVSESFWYYNCAGKLRWIPRENLLALKTSEVSTKLIIISEKETTFCTDLSRCRSNVLCSTRTCGIETFRKTIQVDESVNRTSSWLQIKSAEFLS